MAICMMCNTLTKHALKCGCIWKGCGKLILEQIKEKLQEIDENVFYCIVDDRMRDTFWNYIVFNRKPTKISANKTGYSYYFTVNIVREDFIPEGLDLTVIEKMREIPNMKLADTDMQYTYVPKPNTNTVVEMLSIDFVKAVKG